MKKSPAFQFYPDDFIGGTVEFTAAEVGAYIRLLCYAWSNGAIPKSRTSTNRIAGCNVSSRVFKKFKNGRNLRLDEEREKQRIWKEKSSLGGKKSAEKRAKDGSTTLEAPLQPPYQPNSNTPSSSSSPSPKERKPTKLPASFTSGQIETTARFDTALGNQWENDRQKWMGRIKHHPVKSQRVIAEVENAAKEARINTTPAQYAEQIWKEFV